MRLARLDSERGGGIGEMVRHLRLIHVHANSDDGIMNAIGLGAHLGEYAAEFTSADEEIIRPANIGPHIEIFRRCVICCEASDKREKRGVRGRNERPQQNAAIDAGRFLRGPLSAGAASTGSLLLGNNNCPMGFTGFAEAHGH